MLRSIRWSQGVFGNVEEISLLFKMPFPAWLDCLATRC